MSVGSLLRRTFFIPIWVWKDKSPRLSYLKEMEASQYHKAEDLQEWQFRHMIRMIGHAYRNTAYYRKLFDNLGIKPEDISNFDHFKKLPLLSKHDIQENMSNMVAASNKKDSLIPFKTGGSTGKPITVFWDFNSMEKAVGAAMRSFQWAGWEIGAGWGRVWGNPAQNVNIRDKLRNWLIEPEFFLDTMNLNETTVLDFAKVWKRERPSMLHGHAHSLYVFAQICSRFHLNEIRPRGIISTSMMLLAPERKLIEKTFKCPVTDLYGCEEVGLIGCECEEHKGLHINAENVYVEFLDSQGNEVTPGKEGTIVVTSLINGAMPLIRYRIEDMGIPSGRTCKCGRGLPLMEKVSGRTADFLVRNDGSLVAGVSLIERTLTAIPGIQQLQIIQHDVHTFSLNIVKDSSFGFKTEALLAKEFKDVFGEQIRITFNYVQNIVQHENGKYMFSISKVSNPYIER